MVGWFNYEICLTLIWNCCLSSSPFDLTPIMTKILTSDPYTSWPLKHRLSVVYKNVDFKTQESFVIQKDHGISLTQWSPEEKVCTGLSKEESDVSSLLVHVPAGLHVQGLGQKLLRNVSDPTDFPHGQLLDKIRHFALVPQPELTQVQSLTQIYSVSFLQSIKGGIWKNITFFCLNPEG